MDGKTRVRAPALLASILWGLIGRAAGGEPAADTEACVVRLVHPDRQAAEVLRLFRGARWSDPAAALAAWKQQNPDAGLGKPVEALIALFNPEMAREWRAFDRAEIRIGLDPASGEIGWYALIPGDDGTVAAGITAMWLTYPDDRPLVVDGSEIPVARLGRSGGPLACQIGTAIVLSSDRARLERGVANARAGRPSISGIPKSGTVFRLDPAKLRTRRGAPLAQLQWIEALRALGCRSVEGAAFLEDGSLTLDVSTTLPARPPDTAADRPRSVEIAWLEALPSEGVMAMASLAIDPGPASWDFAFAAADRIERVDPARARLAPLRTRLNLLAMGAGLKLEADVRPHLRGVSACLYGEANSPGRVAGGLIVLHLDEPEVAARLVERASPRLGALGDGDAASRAVSLRPRGRDIWIAWGEGIRKSEPEARPVPARSLAALCGGWAAQDRKAPRRVGAVWPARVWRPAGMTEPAIRALDEDPPVIWWGWTEPGRMHDVVRWSGLGDRVRDLLATLPGDPVPAPDGPGSRTRDSKLKIAN